MSKATDGGDYIDCAVRSGEDRLEFNTISSRTPKAPCRVKRVHMALRISPLVRRWCGLSFVVPEIGFRWVNE
jgi:hypothetical protein